MNRFYTSTIFFILIALGTGFLLEGLLRWLALGLLLIAYLVIFTLGIYMLKLNYFANAFCRGDTTARSVALTFDDGPDPETTPALLKTLNDHGVKAAFFPTGTNARSHPEIIKKIDQQGHVLGNHSFRHAWWTNFLMAAALEREIGRAQETIEAVIGKVPAYFRPPMGLTNPHLPKKLKKHGLAVVGWDVRPFDTRASSEKVINKVLKKVRNGSIILLHDLGRGPAELAQMVDELVTEIKARGYNFSELEELLGIEAYQTQGKVTGLESSIFTRAWQESGAGGQRVIFFSTTPA